MNLHYFEMRPSKQQLPLDLDSCSAHGKVRSFCYLYNGMFEARNSSSKMDNLLISVNQLILNATDPGIGTDQPGVVVLTMELDL